MESRSLSTSRAWNLTKVPDHPPSALIHYAKPAFAAGRAKCLADKWILWIFSQLETALSISNIYYHFRSCCRVITTNGREKVFRVRFIGLSVAASFCPRRANAIFIAESQLNPLRSLEQTEIRFSPSIPGALRWMSSGFQSDYRVYLTVSPSAEWFLGIRSESHFAPNDMLPVTAQSRFKSIKSRLCGIEMGSALRALQ